MKENDNDLGNKENIKYRIKKYRCLIHLDRLIITLRLTHDSRFRDIRNPDNIPILQYFGDFMLKHDCSPGSGAYYHSYKVYYQGIIAGMLHTSNKMRKNEIQFHFNKELFYSNHSSFWYEVYILMARTLGFEYNNIHYVEVAVDTDKDVFRQFQYFYSNMAENKSTKSDRYSVKKGTMIHSMNNGSSFVVNGSDNNIAIYAKSGYAEKFIHDYFRLNGFGEVPVYRIECRLKWNYIRYLRNKKNLDIKLETLSDQRQLASIFKIATKNKLSFKDRLIKDYDSNRNITYTKVSVLDDLPIDSTEISKLKSTFISTHYSTNTVDENILRQNYYRYLETGKKDYLKSLAISGKAAGFGDEKIENLLRKFNRNYKGHWTILHTKRLQLAEEYLSSHYLSRLKFIFSKVIGFFNDIEHEPFVKQLPK